ncbi:hypothetical protein K449DRAFT_432251 [Hypoxylon sp. EC38]|nr:hypothetical protein K449DRAFT_432251 [Hypoxylon sp. EC38]
MRKRWSVSSLCVPVFPLPIDKITRTPPFSSARSLTSSTRIQGVVLNIGHGSVRVTVAHPRPLSGPFIFVCQTILALVYYDEPRRSWSLFRLGYPSLQWSALEALVPFLDTSPCSSFSCTLHSSQAAFTATLAHSNSRIAQQTLGPPTGYYLQYLHQPPSLHLASTSHRSLPPFIAEAIRLPTSPTTLINSTSSPLPSPFNTP